MFTELIVFEHERTKVKQYSFRFLKEMYIETLTGSQI